ncbi:MAG: WSD1 family O-acyltransferase, partial [Chloroflexi bacterium]|nr:WSD1 family O-acyltransferase [Chloroflexota bacterium]
GIVFLSLPVGIGDPLTRLNEVHKRMMELKNSKEAPVAMGILSAMGMSPDELQGTLVKLFGSKATAVMTNVPGPPMPLYLAGQKIEGLMFWVPQTGRVSLGISIISYANKVFLGIASDAGLVPDPDLILEGFYEEFEAMMTLMREAKAVAEEEATLVKTAVPTQTDQCQGTTKSGKQCRNRASDGSNYCHIHQK